ncbi:LuxR C-terminal-related transcriptional regulator [Salinivibrio kushneri]|uniref:LuxR C-terminal-related transcriptional regulator n=1 Tax=Salinivibrio kushneri TaxID=1908198 RepID=A0AA47LR13_9GAMM|nr:LuxR C-terminal-related transcriptional regulator [Salinivibrio kushneri]WBA08284.1 LuxR C-terminal-related transcriptional regulator [Salinivibrio kushneri]
MSEIEEELLLAFKLSRVITYDVLDRCAFPYRDTVKKKLSNEKENIRENGHEYCYLGRELSGLDWQTILSIIDNDDRVFRFVSVLPKEGVNRLYENLLKHESNVNHYVSVILQVMIDLNLSETPLFLVNKLMRQGFNLERRVLVKAIKIYLVFGKFEQAKLCYNVFFGNDSPDSSSYGEIVLYHIVRRLEHGETLSVDLFFEKYQLGKIDIDDEEAVDLLTSTAQELFLLSRFDDCQHLLKNLLPLCQRRKRWISLYYGYFLNILCAAMSDSHETALGRYELYTLLPYRTHKMEYMTTVAIIISSLWAGKGLHTIDKYITRFKRDYLSSADNCFYQIYSLYCNMLIEVSRERFSFKSFVAFERKLISVYEYNQVSEAWNTPDFYSLYELARCRDERVRLPCIVKASFVEHFYQEQIRNYLRNRPCDFKPPILFVCLKRSMQAIDLQKEGTSCHALSKKEREIVELLKLGYSYKDLASALNISINTVKSHANNIYKKLGVKGRYDLL